MSAQAVGQAVGKNPVAIMIPCHRVVKKNGDIAEAFAFGGANVQRDLLLSEGVIFIDDNTVDMKKCVCDISEIAL